MNPSLVEHMKEIEIPTKFKINSEDLEVVPQEHKKLEV